MRASSVAGIVVSAGALAVLFTGTALGLDRRLDAWLADPEGVEVEVVPEVATAEGVSASAPAAGASEVDAAPVPVEPAPEAEGVVVPDVGAMTVSRGWRTFRELGLRLVVRDAYGEAIPPEDAPLYRVRGETLEPAPGTRVPRGTTVRARARDAMPRAFAGY